MPQRKTGTVERRRDQWYGRVSLPNGTRPWVPIGPAKGDGNLSEARAREQLASLVEKGTANGQLEAYVARLRGGMAPRRGHRADTAGVQTVRQLGEAWTSDALLEQYGAVNRLRSLASAKVNAWTMTKHVYPVKVRAGAHAVAFGDLPVADVTPADIEAVMAAQPRGQAAQTRKHTYQRLRRLFDLAIFPCKLRAADSNPVKPYLRPERDPEKQYSYLYPSEVLKLLRTTSIPLGRRILYLLAVYWGARKGSLYALKWGGIDFDHFMVSMLKVKGRRRAGGEPEAGSKDTGGTPLYFHAEHRSVLEVLRRWHKHCGEPGSKEAIIRDTGVERNHDEAKLLRADLEAAGVPKARLAILQSDAPNVQPLRLHDARATFCTWARRAGKSDAWIAERTGHRPSGRMIERYARQAQTLADLGYEPFPDVTDAIPELSTPVSTPPGNAGLGTERGGSETPKTAQDARSQAVLPVC